MIIINNLFYEKNFGFYKLKMRKYHYTDNRSGSPRNFIAYMEKGSSRIVSSNNSIENCEGDFFFIPKNLPYESYWYGNDEISFISIGFDNMPTDGYKKYKLQKLICSDEIKEKIKSIPIGCPITAHGLSIFYDALDKLISIMEAAPINKEQQTLMKLKNYIYENPFSSVSDLSKACFISESYIYYLFKKYMKISPNDFRQSVVCDIAVNYLLTSDKKIEEICNILKFSSSSYFRKVLKKHTGKSPREIRKSAAI